jgi:cytochrome c oxidase subunit 3
MEHAPGSYYVPHGTRWPIIGSVGLFTLLLGTALSLNDVGAGSWIALAGFGAVLFMMAAWFGEVIGESERGLYSKQVDSSFRWGMSWFIFSEVMFFAVFFGALFYTRVLVVPWLAGEGDSFFTNRLLWPDFENAWPATGPGRDPVERMGAWGIPAINTAILLLSGVTLTIAHHMLRAHHRRGTAIWLAATFLLGFSATRLSAWHNSACERRVAIRRPSSNGFSTKSFAPRRMASRARPIVLHAVITVMGSAGSS